jgi:hypothetical protein
MGFFDNATKKFEAWEKKGLERRKKRLIVLRQKARIVGEESKYHAQMNKAKSERWDSFNKVIMGDEKKKQDDASGSGFEKWF